MEQGRAGESRSSAILRQTSRDLSLTCLMRGLDLARCVSDLLGFASWCPSASPRSRRLRSVSPLFSMVNPWGVLGAPSPTLKTGRRESVSWVQIPPHPFGCSRRVAGVRFYRQFQGSSPPGASRYEPLWLLTASPFAWLWIDGPHWDSWGHRHRHLSAPASASESARPHGHLEALKSRFPDSLGGCEILDSCGTD